MSGDPGPLCVLGAGSWGTALAIQLARRNATVPVRLWARDPAHVDAINAARVNQRYLPDYPLPDSLSASADLDAALEGAELALLVVPSRAFVALLEQLAPRLPATAGFAWASKGLEPGSGRFFHQLIDDTLDPRHPSALISGPSFAAEVAAGLPTALSVTSRDADYAHHLATLLHGEQMLAYTGNDLIGVQLGGAIKNALAIAAGIADGLGYGANARAALITRGLAELRRLGDALGARPETLMGLTGIGDLVLTCTDDQSRNRRFGLALGRGVSPEQALADIDQVVEGASATDDILRLASRQQISMPICEQVQQVLSGHSSPRQAVATLLARGPGPE